MTRISSYEQLAAIDYNTYYRKQQKNRKILFEPEDNATQNPNRPNDVQTTNP